MTSLMTVRDLCGRLKVSRATVERMIRDPVDPLPLVRLGRARRISERELAHWLRRRRARAMTA